MISVHTAGVFKELARSDKENNNKRSRKRKAPKFDRGEQDNVEY